MMKTELDHCVICQEEYAEYHASDYANLPVGKLRSEVIERVYHDAYVYSEKMCAVFFVGEYTFPVCRTCLVNTIATIDAFEKENP